MRYDKHTDTDNNERRGRHVVRTVPLGSSVGQLGIDRRTASKRWVDRGLGNILGLHPVARGTAPVHRLPMIPSVC